MSWIDLVGGEAAASEWHDIAVYVWLDGGKLSVPSRKLIARARMLAEQLGCYLKVVGAEVKAPGVSASFVEDPAAFVEREKPEILLFDDTPRAVPADVSTYPPVVAARLAQKLRTGLGYAHDVDLDVNQRLLVMRSRAYGGKMVREQVCPTARPQMCLLETEGLPDPGA